MCCINSYSFVQNTKIANGKGRGDSVILKTVLGRCGRKMKILIFCGKSHILIWNTKITNEEVLGDSVILETELSRYG